MSNVQKTHIQLGTKVHERRTLVDQNRWDQIQKLFPEKCHKRLRSNGDDESDDECPPVKRVLAKCGELRQEYEEEIKKIRERKEKEEEASKNLIIKYSKNRINNGNNRL
ncbi:E3 ubiquitin-protein ligase rnf168-like [Xenia sp. Carnegie-2017]|uniref:E3 ubiquitin-protein ligase rnf168-like n=1 Tax=Xenia sp. Carnegie-2017 TaxID=2897299 RepID=UPI001F0471B0|nr:E3 ubiquitin-protein ligase rnf168-like [Xenia sp. Carnegie-2017]